MLECLRSLDGVDAEIVVLDNASEDGSVDAVESFPGVRVIAQPFRAGFAANHNTVIRATTGRYVYVLNEDTTSEDWALERIVSHLDAQPAGRRARPAAGLSRTGGSRTRPGVFRLRASARSGS